MMIKKQTSPKKNLLLGAVAGAILLATLVFLYFTILREPAADLNGAGALGQLAPIRKIDVNFQTELFEDPRIEGLKQYGPETVEVTERGRKADPFEAF